MTVVMGLDQHRAQITADWLDTETGEVSRARVMPADRLGVRRFLARFAGQQLEVALEATTGWRFVVEELLAVGAEPHLAEPAEASALKGNKRRAKTDRGDARHLRELLMTGRLPESYIAPEHLLDLRARVRLRHALVDQRGEWQQRIHAVLYHHGHPQKAGLLTAANRTWLERLALPDAAREQVTVALAMIDALDAQSAAITAQLRRYARRQAGCRALMGLYGVGEPTAVAILAELGDTRRFSSSRQAVRYAGLDITVHQSDSAARPDTSPAKDRPRCAGRSTKPRKPRGGPAAPTAPTTPKPPNGSAATAPASHWHANCSSAASTSCANSATKPYSPPDHGGRCARSPSSPDAPRPAPRMPLPPPRRWTAYKDRAAATRHPAGTPDQPSRHRPRTEGRGPG